MRTIKIGRNTAVAVLLLGVSAGLAAQTGTGRPGSGASESGTAKAEQPASPGAKAADPHRTDPPVAASDAGRATSGVRPSAEPGKASTGSGHPSRAGFDTPGSSKKN